MQDTHCAEEIKFGRRQLLVGASLAGAIATLPKAAQAETETPVMRLFREWETAFAASRAYEGKDEDEVDRLSDVYIEIEDRMMAAKAETAQDVFAKVWAYTSGGQSNLPDIAHPVGEVFWSEAKAVLA